MIRRKRALAKDHAKYSPCCGRVIVRVSGLSICPRCGLLLGQKITWWDRTSTFRRWMHANDEEFRKLR